MTKLPSATRAAGSPERFGIGGSDARTPFTGTPQVQSGLAGIGAGLASAGSTLAAASRRREAEGERIRASERARALTRLDTDMLLANDAAVQDATQADPADALRLYSERMDGFRDLIDGFEDEDLRVRATAALESRMSRGIAAVRTDAGKRQADRSLAGIMEQGATLVSRIRAGTITPMDAASMHDASVDAQVDAGVIGETQAARMRLAFGSEAANEWLTGALHEVERGTMSADDLESFMVSEFGLRHTTASQRSLWLSEARKSEEAANIRFGQQQLAGASERTSEIIGSLPMKIDSDTRAAAEGELMDTLMDIVDGDENQAGLMSRNGLPLTYAQVAATVLGDHLDFAVRDGRPESLEIIAAALSGQPGYSMGDDLGAIDPRLGSAIRKAESDMLRSLTTEAVTVNAADMLVSALTNPNAEGSQDVIDAAQGTPSVRNKAAAKLVEEGADPQALLAVFVARGLPVPAVIDGLIRDGFETGASAEDRALADNLLRQRWRANPASSHELASSLGGGTVATAYEVAFLTGNDPDETLTLLLSPNGQTAISAWKNIAGKPHPDFKDLDASLGFTANAAKANGLNIPAGYLPAEQRRAFDSLLMVALAKIAGTVDLTSDDRKTDAMENAASMAMAQMLETHSFIVDHSPGPLQRAFDIAHAIGSINPIWGQTMGRATRGLRSGGTSHMLVRSNMYRTEPGKPSDSLTKDIDESMRGRPHLNGMRAMPSLGFEAPIGGQATVAIPLYSGSNMIPQGFLLYDRQRRRIHTDIGPEQGNIYKTLSSMSMALRPPNMMGPDSIFRAGTGQRTRGYMADTPMADSFRDFAESVRPDGLPSDQWLDYFARSYGWRGYESRTQSGN